MTREARAFLGIVGFDAHVGGGLPIGSHVGDLRSASVSTEPDRVENASPTQTLRVHPAG